MTYKEEILARIKNAIIIAKDGDAYKVDDLWMRVDKNGVLNVSADSQYTNLKKVTKQSSIKELNEIKAVFGEMIRISPELQNFILNKSLQFNLYDNYGMGSIRICSELNGTITWGAALEN